MTYQYVLAIHIVFVVSWMAGLFYIVRLFIYHTEANEKPEVERDILQRQYELMESKLFNIITTPAMVLTVAAGVTMLYLSPGLWSTPWFHVKLFFVILLIAYHFYCRHLLKQLKRGVFKMSSFQLRLWNELATILLVAIVFTVILKTTIDWFYGLAGLIIFAVVIMSAVKWYRSYRQRHEQ